MSHLAKPVQPNRKRHPKDYQLADSVGWFCPHSKGITAMPYVRDVYHPHHITVRVSDFCYEMCELCWKEGPLCAAWVHKGWRMPKM